jgi:hypothetical protein
MEYEYNRYRFHANETLGMAHARLRGWRLPQLVGISNPHN